MAKVSESYHLACFFDIIEEKQSQVRGRRRFEKMTVKLIFMWGRLTFQQHLKMPAGKS